MAACLASTERIVKRFSETPAALDGVSMRIMAGEMTGLIGPDGAGKTTLIRLLAGLMDADGGTLSVLGGDPREGLEALGYMPQRFGLYEDLTVLQNLDLYADLRKLPKAERAAQYKQLLEFTDLARFQGRLAGKLSGGMKQKLGLACALVRTPRLLLLDEPGVGVDPIARRELWEMVASLTGQGMGVLWATAYLDEAEKCDKVYLLNEGRLLFEGPPAQLTTPLAERVIMLTGFASRRRQALARALNRPEVVDGTLQGRAVRLLLREGSAPPAPALWDEGPELTIAPAPARFEDGFIDRLGGGPKGTSPLAARYRDIPANDKPVIEARGLTKRFGDFTAASNVNFTVRRGEIFGLLGPNGAGKSTTFKMLCGLLRPSEGTGLVNGFDIRRSGPQARTQLGYMAQKFSLYADLSVQQNLDFFAGAYDLDRAAARRASAAIVEIFELGPVLHINAGTMPLGFKQRLALACAVLHEPPVLFLDEPTSGVDPRMRREFWAHINGLVEKGVTVLVTTHFMDEAEYCDNITLIYRSEQIASGTPDQLKAEVAAMGRIERPTMEDSFVALIEASDALRAEQEAA